MTLDESVHAFRLRVMVRAQVIGDVTQACRGFGISRSLFYSWRKRYLAYGADGLHPRRQGAHVTARTPGELVCLDTFYIGKLEGVRKVWQPALPSGDGSTACVTACAYAVTQVTTDFAAAAVSWLRARQIPPASRATGWALLRVLTDQGIEFRRAFDETCTQ